MSLGKLLVNIASVFVAADSQLLRHLERDSEWLQQQLGQFALISGDFVTKFAFEEYETPTMLGHEIMVRNLHPAGRGRPRLTEAGGAACVSRCAGPGGRRALRDPRRPS